MKNLNNTSTKDKNKIIQGCIKGTCNSFNPEIEEKEIILNNKNTMLKPERPICDETINEKAWIDNPSILFTTKTWYKFIPSEGMSKNQILNSFARFGFYYFLIMLLIRRSVFDFFILLLTLAISLYLYKANILIEERDKALDVPLSFSEYTKPTEHNPFMNTLVSDLGKEEFRAPAEDIKNEDVKKEVEYYFNKNLYKDSKDLYNKNNSQFSYHTVPNTRSYGVGVGDKVLFANYLYNTPKPTCKENTSFCNNEYSYNDDFKNIAQRSKPLNPYEKTMIEKNMLFDLNHKS